MNPFQYLEASDEGAALAVMSSEPEAKFLAGGTTLIDLMKLGVEQPAVLVDINRWGAVAIEDRPDGVYLGAMARNSEVAAHPAVRARFPMLSEAILQGASPQLRNMATVGGNLMQRTRCYYFRDRELPCNKREPGSGCSAINGFHRIHAILGVSEQCIATNPGDMAVALTALDAMVHLESPRGRRDVALTEFHLLPGDTPQRETVLEHDELITGVTVPDLPWARTSRYLKVRDRASYEFALTSAAVALDLEDGSIREARVALGGVGTKPWRSREAEAALRGAPGNSITFRAAAEAALQNAKPGHDNAFKVELAKRTITEALSMVANGVKA